MGEINLEETKDLVVIRVVLEMEIKEVSATIIKEVWVSKIPLNFQSHK